jgi:hypothetical protein
MKKPLDPTSELRKLREKQYQREKMIATEHT